MKIEMADPPRTRRQRVRDATVRELVSTGRELLTTHGADGLTVRAVAREMGMTAPAVYRYFGSHQELMDAVMVDVLGEVYDYVSRAVDEVDPANPAARLVAASRALHRWGTRRPREFHLTLNAPEEPEAEDSAVALARRRLGMLFGGLFVALWQKGGVPVPRSPRGGETAQVAKRLRERLEMPLPDGALMLFARCMLRLFGMVSVEATGLTRTIGDTGGAVFEAELKELARTLNISDRDLATGR